MRGIILKDSIKQFGFKMGSSFWFRWSFKYPTEMFIWKYITIKPYCLNCGYHCRDESNKKLTKQKDILAR